MYCTIFCFQGEEDCIGGEACVLSCSDGVDSGALRRRPWDKKVQMVGGFVTPGDTCALI
jgi:hypothetical protein